MCDFLKQQGLAWSTEKPTDLKVDQLGQGVRKMRTKEVKVGRENLRVVEGCRGGPYAGVQVD